MDKNKLTKRCGFTLSENLTVITVLGIIIALTVPNLIREQNVKHNRIVVRKAVSNYQNILKKLLIGATGVKTTADFNNYLMGTNCSKIRNQMDVELFNGCVFITSDGVKWDLTTPSEAIIQISGTGVGNTTSILTNNNTYKPVLAKTYNKSDITVFYVPFSAENRELKMFASGTSKYLANDANRNSAKIKTRSFVMGE